MNRGQIKELAKQKIKGNKWNIWWPLLVIGVLEGILERAFSVAPNVNITNFSSTFSVEMEPKTYIGLTLITLLFGIINAGYLKYIINFTRTGKFDSNDIIETFKARWLDIIIAVVLTTIIVFACTLALVIPGIIMGLAYTLVIFLVVDKGIKGQDALRVSRETMRGHKWEYFVFCLSFIGWFLLIPFTLGIICIWLVPYFYVANTIYLDQLSQNVPTSN